jgi:hypothetical protein
MNSGLLFSNLLEADLALKRAAHSSPTDELINTNLYFHLTMLTLYTSGSKKAHSQRMQTQNPTKEDLEKVPGS